MERQIEPESEKVKVRKHRTFKETITHNFWLKILALVFSILLWSYVINVTNPVRAKIFADLPIAVNGLADLQGQRLVPLEDLSTKLPHVSVTLNIPHKELKNVASSSIQVYIDLSRLTGVGKQTVPINVVCNNADVSVVNYYPQTVEIVIDELAAAVIPVRLNTTGVLPDTLYQNEPTLQPQTISISGPQEYISRITQARVDVDLSRMTDGYIASVPYTFVNQDGQTISAVNIAADSSAVLVDMGILSKKAVPVEFLSKIIGKDALAEGYEFQSAAISRPAVSVVGTAQALSELTQLVIKPVDLTGLDASDLSVLTELEVPQSVTVLGGTVVQVQLTIVEKTELRSYQVPVQYRNVPEGCVPEPRTVTVVLRGKYFTLAGIGKENISVTADLAGLPAGTHWVELEPAINTYAPSVTMEISPTEVSVTVPEQAEEPADS